MAAKPKHDKVRDFLTPKLATERTSENETRSCAPKTKRWAPVSKGQMEQSASSGGLAGPTNEKAMTEEGQQWQPEQEEESAPLLPQPFNARVATAWMTQRHQAVIKQYKQQRRSGKQGGQIQRFHDASPASPLSRKKSGSFTQLLQKAMEQMREPSESVPPPAPTDASITKATTISDRLPQISEVAGEVSDTESSTGAGWDWGLSGCEDETDRMTRMTKTMAQLQLYYVPYAEPQWSGAAASSLQIQLVFEEVVVAEPDLPQHSGAQTRRGVRHSPARIERQWRRNHPDAVWQASGYDGQSGFNVPK
jgi:hypothetical protein